jgi:5,10-methylene-tetrahydrofolate dehydrogenase/methenyl tetrahydrofolate cyclohydrolase
MAITQDGTQAFSIESSPCTINAVVYILEALSFSYEGERKDISDSNGEPTGAVVVPRNITVSGTLQLATATTEPNVRQEDIVLSGTRNDGTYTIVDCSEAETQGDYVKVSFNAYKKIN